MIGLSGWIRLMVMWGGVVGKIDREVTKLDIL